MSDKKVEIKDQAQLDEFIKNLFVKLDLDKNNTLDLNEIQIAVNNYSKQKGSQAVEKDVIVETFKSLDLDHNKQLSFDEFKNFIYKLVISS